ncbi:hypothetical protein BpHYR1_043180 [Brachionus plicatilis]|uniref:Uncharacterized protein n=1 Tax=Brachionus plicatilis TaxID=10195 RepID=A0A3M7R978_BRAPC|nr:hypothetical protein BpHYR1_043180 [Brachionus plicatilis]
MNSNFDIWKSFLVHIKNGLKKFEEIMTSLACLRKKEEKVDGVPDLLITKSGTRFKTLQIYFKSKMRALQQRVKELNTIFF